MAMTAEDRPKQRSSDLQDPTFSLPPQAVEAAVATISSGGSDHEVLAETRTSTRVARDFLQFPRRLTIGPVNDQVVELWIAPNHDIESVATLNAVAQAQARLFFESQSGVLLDCFNPEMTLRTIRLCHPGALNRNALSRAEIEAGSHNPTHTVQIRAEH